MIMEPSAWVSYVCRSIARGGEKPLREVKNIAKLFVDRDVLGDGGGSAVDLGCGGGGDCSKSCED